MTSRLLTPDRLKFRCDGKKVYYTEEVDVPKKYDIQEVIENTRKFMRLALDSMPHKLRFTVKNKHTVVASFSFAYKKKTQAFAMIAGELLGIILNEDPKMGKRVIDGVSSLISAYAGNATAQRQLYEALYDVKPIETQLPSDDEVERLCGQGFLVDSSSSTSGQLDFSTLGDNSDVALPEYQTVGEILDSTAGFKVMAVRGDQALNTWDVRIQDNPDPSVWRVISSGLSEQKAKRYAVGLQNVFNYVGSSTPETGLQPTVVPK